MILEGIDSTYIEMYREPWQLLGGDSLRGERMAVAVGVETVDLKSIESMHRAYCLIVLWDAFWLNMLNDGRNFVGLLTFDHKV